MIILVIAMSTNWDKRQLSWPEKFIKDTVSWTQSIIYKPANAIAGFFQDVHDFSIIFQENKSLKSSLHQYSQVVAELNQYKDENKRLKQMLAYKEKKENQYQLRIGKVIARSPDRWNNMLVIDQGARDGVEQDMAVITTSGLVGKVYSVSSFSSNIQLISDSEHNGFVFASIQSNPRTYGVIEGYDKQKNELNIKKIALDANVEPGQLVTTSSLGGVFPTGLIIGEIVRVEEGENGGLTKTAYVKPAADLYQIDEVFIVTKATVQEEPKGENGTSDKKEEEKGA